MAGVVSTNPAHIMNSGLQGEFTVAVALSGRVPVSVIGNISAGDRVVTSNRAGVAEAMDMGRYQPGLHKAPPALKAQPAQLHKAPPALKAQPAQLHKEPRVLKVHWVPKEQQERALL